ncbi:MAG: hypothetical protein AAF127_06455 [Pseudomonadota bacterium]
MIDKFALALGHALLGIAMLRLVVREGLDVDPLLARLSPKKRRARRAHEADAHAEDTDTP